MAKLTAWIFAIIGILIILAAFGLFSTTEPWFLFVVGVALLVIAIGKFVRMSKFSGKRR
jgi:uncharacterized membrane protein